MTKTYAIADTHGMYDLLMKAIDAIKLGDGDRIVTLGDYVDRGPKSAEIIQYLMEHPEIIALRGNHEGMLADWLDFKWDTHNYMMNGGNMTLLSYGQKVGEMPDRGAVPVAHKNWIRRLPFYYQDAHRIYVHAGLDPTKKLPEQTESDMTWRLYKGYKGGFGNFHVVHGHEQFEDGPKLYEGRTNLDTGAFYSNRLAVGVFDDEKAGGPVEIMEIT